MASTDRIFVSPGVFTSEKDLTFVTRQVGVTTLGLLGETPKGPAFEPVFISNYDEFTSYFGGLNTQKFKGTGFQKYELNYIAKSFLTQTNQLYISRILGYSGYEAGNAWSITMNAAQDDSTTGVTTTTVEAVSLTYSAFTTGAPISMEFTNPILQAQFDSGAISGLFSAIGAGTTGTTFADTTPTFVSAGTCALSASTFNMSITLDGTPCISTGNPLDSCGGSTGFTAAAGVVTGVTSGTVVTYSATCFTDIDDAVVATLRSRGQYNGTEDLIFDVVSVDDAVMTDTGAVISNPLANFLITGSSGSNTFSYEVSFDKTKPNLITSVLGTGAQDKSTELFVEEIYLNSLEDLIAEGKVLGLTGNFVEMPGSGATHNLNDYLQQWEHASTPYVLSELRGSNLERLFRFITISDGNAANKDVKFSIVNIKPDEKTFDVLVRNFYDTDANMSIVEKYSRCTMDEKSNGFIGRKIGTSDGEYPLRSKYIMVELDKDANITSACGFPAGFEGVLNRDYIGSNRTAIPPQIEYKTTYDSFNTSKLRKQYLGLNSDLGIDQDFFDYKGENSAVVSGDYTGKTDGFHLDVNAAGAEIIGDGISYFPVLQVGISAFTTSASIQTGPYEKLAARKFTFAPFGGWDGWDVYRLQRTNTDTYSASGTKGPLGESKGIFSPFTTTEGDVGNTSDFYAYLNGIYTFNNPEAVNINVFATPGIDLRDQNSLIESAVDMVEVDRADSLYIITTPDVNDDNEALSTGEAVDIVEDSTVVSNYSATYWPWLQMNDTENNQYVWLPPTVEVVRNIALTDNVAFPWFAAAGLNRGTTNAIKARLKLTLDQRDDLYEGRINPMATFSDVGVVIWGNKTLQEKETALNRINVRRLLLQARKLISAVSIRLLFEQNDDVVRNQFLSLVNPILDNIRKERGLTDFRVVLDDTPESIDRNELNGKIYIKPTRSLEYISIEFVITNTGASFDDI